MATNSSGTTAVLIFNEQTKLLKSNNIPRFAKVGQTAHLKSNQPCLFQEFSG